MWKPCGCWLARRPGWVATSRPMPSLPGWDPPRCRPRISTCWGSASTAPAGRKRPGASGRRASALQPDHPETIAQLHHPRHGAEPARRGRPACRAAGPAAGLGAPRRAGPGRAPRRAERPGGRRGRPAACARAPRSMPAWIARRPLTIASSSPATSCGSRGRRGPCRSFENVARRWRRTPKPPGCSAAQRFRKEPSPRRSPRSRPPARTARSIPWRSSPVRTWASPGALRVTATRSAPSRPAGTIRPWCEGSPWPSSPIRTEPFPTPMIPRSRTRSGARPAGSTSKPGSRTRCSMRSSTTPSARPTIISHWSATTTKGIPTSSGSPTTRPAGTRAGSGRPAIPPTPRGDNDFLGKPIDVIDGIHKCLFCHATDPKVGARSARARRRTIGRSAASAAMAPAEIMYRRSRRSSPTRRSPTRRRLRPRAGSGSAASATANHQESSLPRTDPFWIRFQGTTIAWSRCYTESAGSFDCMTCHDPHHDTDRSDASITTRDA